MKITLHSIDDGQVITWDAAVWERGKPCVCTIRPPEWRTYTSRNGAIRAGLRTLKRLFPGVEIEANWVKENA